MMSVALVLTTGVVTLRLPPGRWAQELSFLRAEVIPPLRCAHLRVRIDADTLHVVYTHISLHITIDIFLKSHFQG